jgi:hypothetical protein
MRITGIAGHQGVPVITIDGRDRLSDDATPMRVFTRENVGRHEGYGSISSALAAARNLSRGADRSAVVVQRPSTGNYEVRDAVWQLLLGVDTLAADRLPFRHFHFEDGTFSSYTAIVADRKVQVQASGSMRAYDGVTRWLVDGSRVVEVTSTGPAA